MYTCISGLTQPYLSIYIVITYILFVYIIYMLTMVRLKLQMTASPARGPESSSLRRKRQKHTD